MPFPPVAKENYISFDISSPQELQSSLEKLRGNVHALYIYLERLRNLSFDEIIFTIESQPSVVVENLIGSLENTFTISYSFDSVTNKLSFFVNDGSITEIKLGDLSVSTAKLQNLAVTTGKINSLAVTVDKLASDSVSTVKVIDKNITYAKIQDERKNTLLGRNATTDGAVQEIDIGTGLTLVGTTLVSSGNADTGVKRVVDTTETRTIPDTYSVVVSNYFKVLGILVLQGDASVEIL